jgi:hypothetical protein
MDKCPFNHTAAVGAVPPRIAKLPVLRGFHVPWFVEMVNGEYDFRVMSGKKLKLAVKLKLCWVCGEPLGALKSFVIGPMCGINHTSAEPPSHRECAEYSATTCPFLTRPNMKRRENDVELADPVGMMIRRNPGVCAVWTVRGYTVFRVGNGILFDVGDPEDVDWYAEGRKATREEVLASIDSGIHLLEEACETEDTAEKRAKARRELQESWNRLKQYLP